MKKLILNLFVFAIILVPLFVGAQRATPQYCFETSNSIGRPTCFDNEADCRRAVEACRENDRCGLIIGSTYCRATTSATPTGASPANPGPSAPDTPSTGVQTGEVEQVQLINPLNGINTVWEFADKIMVFVVRLSVPIIVIFLILAGFKFVIAQGKPEKIKEARQMIKFVLIGAAIILSARIITSILVSTIGTITG